MRRIVSEGLYTRLEGVCSNRMFAGDAEVSEPVEQNRKLHRINGNVHRGEKVIADHSRKDPVVEEKKISHLEIRGIARKHKVHRNSARAHRVL
jgi:hypothetical protein